MLAQKSTELWTTMQRETGRADVDTFLGYVETALVDSEAETHEAVRVLEKIEAGLKRWHAIAWTHEQLANYVNNIVKDYFGEE